MMEIIAIALKALEETVVSWVNSSAEARIELEKRTLDGIQVMRGERKIAHEEIDARTAETRAAIDEARKKLEDEKTKP